jgi:hypothetical protein
MYVHEQSRLVFLAHPRTASVATAEALKKIGFRMWGGSHHMRLWEHSPPRSSPAYPDPRPNGNELLTLNTRREWTVFTTIRNHFDTAVSWVFRRFKDRTLDWSVDGFRTALDYNYWVDPHAMWAMHGADADVILRYETLEDDLARLLKARSLRIAGLPRLNTSGRRNEAHYREFYTPETRAYVQERFKTELIGLGYEF